MYSTNVRVFNIGGKNLIELQRKIDKFHDYIEDFTVFDRSKKKNNLVDLNITINQLDLIYIYILLCQQEQTIYISFVHMEYSPR